MTFLASLTKGVDHDRKRRTVIHGLEGVGKSTWASRFSKPVFIRTEDGCSDLDVARTPVITSYNELLGTIQSLIEESAKDDFPFETTVLDSIDWAETMGIRDMEDRNFDRSYGKGAEEIEKMILRVLTGLSMVCDNGCEVVVIAHSSVQSIRRTDGGEYDTVTPKLSKRANSALKEWADEIAFLEQKVIVKQEVGKFNQSRGVGVTTGEYVIRLNPNPAWVAKNRLPCAVPEEIDRDAFSEYISLRSPNV